MASITLVIFIFFINLLLLHGGVFFLEKEKISIRKASLVVFIIFIVGNITSTITNELSTVLSWAFNIGLVSLIVHLVFRLKKINTLTISTFYIVALIPIKMLLAKIPPQLFMPAQI